MFKLFLKRPAFAIVLSLALVFMGVLAINTLPISQFPDIAPTRVEVNAAFPGASADVLVQSVLIPLEQSINGVQDMRYMTSDATSAGEANIQVVFNHGADVNQALVNVQNRVEKALNQLPEIVQREGVIVNLVQPSMLMYVNLFSTNKNTDEKYLFNYANVNILPELQRISGIARASILGSRQYSMRIWLNPDRMRAYNVSTEEVMNALKTQSVVGSIGRLGLATGQKAQSFEYVLAYNPGRFNDPKQYDNIVIRANPDGSILHLSDVATADLGSEFYDIYSNLDGHPSSACVLKQTYGSNASDIIKNVKVKLEDLKKNFPAGMDYKISYDVSNFVNASIHEVVETLLEAFVLVAAVVFLFLGDWRSTLIPTLAVPISLIGAFMFMKVFGLTINMITLFALVLAIGVVVDDAIVIVEAVNAKMEFENMSPYNAVKAVLDELSGAVISITCLMTAVFVPVAFISGPTGMFYRQFSITMASSIIISGLVALTLTPVLCAIILKNNHGKARKRTPFNIFLDWFNTRFNRMTDRYSALLTKIVKKWYITVGILGVFIAGIVTVAAILPSGFIPNEDQGMIYAIIQTPPGTTLEQTNHVAQQLQQMCEKVEGVESVSALAGYEVLTEGRGSNAGTCMINLKDWDDRKQNVKQIIEELEEKTKNIGAKIEFFEPPAVPGYGAASGFAIRLLDETRSSDFHELEKVNSDFMAALSKRKELAGLFTFFSADYPQYQVNINNDLAMQKGVSIGAALDNLEILVGSTYDLGFTKYERYFKVYVESQAKYRALPEDVLHLYVKNDKGEQVPYSAFMSIKPTRGMNEMTRYNMYPTSAIRGDAAPGYSSGEALKAVQEVAAQVLPHGYSIDYEGITKDQVGEGNQAMWIFLIVLAFVYMVLAAQYESFILPLSVIFSLPSGIFGAFLLVKLNGVANDIYAQVGLVMLVGLLGKNAVLIVEYAIQKHREGYTVAAAAVEGARERFRPILMTSIAFIAGLLPLLTAHGPGAVGDRTLGSAAVGGMVFGTCFGVFVIPGLYYIFGSWASGRKLIKTDEDETKTDETADNEHKEHQ